MAMFLANIIEQIQLAVEHISKGDANNARFGLMLLDNAVEITLHRIAQDKQRSLDPPWYYHAKPYEHHAMLSAARSTF
jgi:hypothetical protein